MATESPASTEASSRPSSPSNVYLDLFIISFVILFFELACIRWFGSTVVFLTFFTNLVLMACFLGMAVGCLAASREQDFMDRSIPWRGWSFLLSCGFCFSTGRLAGSWWMWEARLTPGDLFRDRVRPQRPLLFCRSHRSHRRLVLPAYRLHVRRARTGHGKNLQRDSGPCGGLYVKHRRKPGRHRGVRGGIIFLYVSCHLVFDQSRGLPLFCQKVETPSRHRHGRNARTDRLIRRVMAFARAAPRHLVTLLQD